MGDCAGHAVAGPPSAACASPGTMRAMTMGIWKDSKNGEKVGQGERWAGEPLARRMHGELVGSTPARAAALHQVSFMHAAPHLHSCCIHQIQGLAWPSS